MNYSKLLFTFIALFAIIGQPAFGQKKEPKVKLHPNRKMVNSFVDEGITGPNHEKYINQVVFSSTPIPDEIMNLPTTVFQNEFTIGQPVYGRAFLPKGAIKYLFRDSTINGSDDGIGSDISVLIYIDGKKVPYRDYRIDFLDLRKKTTTSPQRTTFPIKIFRTKEDGGTDIDLNTYINNLSVGNHKVRIECWGGNFKSSSQANVICTPGAIVKGEFTLVVDGNGQMKIGVDFDALEAAMDDDEIEAMMVEAANSQARYASWKEVFSKAIIISDDWTIIRHSLTNKILSRTLSGKLLAKWPDGHCTYQTFSFNEEYDGTNYVGKMKLGTIGGQYQCDCSR